MPAEIRLMRPQWMPLTADDVPTLRPLYDHYLGELVECGGAYTRDGSGVWQPDLFPYWTTPRDFTEPLLLRAGGALLGFAFIGHRPFPYMSAEVDSRVVEFFVSPQHRGTGLARSAALDLLSRRPGKWELSVLTGNDRALAFWRWVVRSEPLQKPEERLEGHEVLIKFTVPRG